jgi:hydrogenase expression/formation protein HypD
VDYRVKPDNDVINIPRNDRTIIMKYVEEYRDPELGKKLLAKIHQYSHKPIKLMEFCGGHTVAIFKSGLRQLLPPTIEMLSGPGCPVCVTAAADLDKAIVLGKIPNVIITSFGDMVRVPGSYSSLQQAKAEGADVRIVYSTQDALAIARENPSKAVVFIGIGFETTAPTVAASILQAAQEKLKNYYVLSLHKVCPPIMKAILDLGEVKLNGIIYPGHVSAIIGSRPYEFIAKDYHIAGAVAGFEPLDIIHAIDSLVEQIEHDHPLVENTYRRGVKDEGNVPALRLMDSIFEAGEANWRGIGIVQSSGLDIREKYAKYDATKHFDIKVQPAKEPPGCICGAVLRGVSTPNHCKLFRRTCTPEHPVGPCMVSSEGSCATYFQYGSDK